MNVEISKSQQAWIQKHQFEKVCGIMEIEFGETHDLGYFIFAWEDVYILARGNECIYYFVSVIVCEDEAHFLQNELGCAFKNEFEWGLI